MNRSLIFASVLALMAGGALAQEAAPAAEAPAPVATTETAAPATAEVPAAATAEADAPEAKVIGEFGAWTVLCADNGQGESCLARQLVSLSEDEENGPKLFVFLEKPFENAPLNLTVGTPLGVSLPAGVSLITAEGQPAPVWQADYQSCMQEMCVASAIVNEPVLLGTEEPAAVFTLMNGEQVGAKFSMEKADEAIAAVVENSPAPAEAADAEAPAEAPAVPAPAGEPPAKAAPAE